MLNYDTYMVMGIIAGDGWPSVETKDGTPQKPATLDKYVVKDGKLSSELNDDIHSTEKQRQELSKEYREAILEHAYSQETPKLLGSGKKEQK